MPTGRISLCSRSSHQASAECSLTCTIVLLKSKLKEKIDEMEKQGIIVKETQTTEWISSLVAVQKSAKLRVCIDPRDLNRAIKRPKYQMPTVDEVLPKLSKAIVFTVLDAENGFHQVKLDNE